MIDSIKNIGLGLLVAQLFSFFNQLIIARFYSPEELGIYSFSIQLAVLFSLIYFIRREYFIVEIKRKSLSLLYLNKTTYLRFFKVIILLTL